MAREVASFGHRVHDTLDDYVVTQTARNMLQAQPEPTAPPQHMVEDPVVAPSPPRTNSATGPVSSWYPHLNDTNVFWRKWRWPVEKQPRLRQPQEKTTALRVAVSCA